jgi:hypothetical protein
MAVRRLFHSHHMVKVCFTQGKQLNLKVGLSFLF